VVAAPRAAANAAALALFSSLKLATGVRLPAAAAAPPPPPPPLARSAFGVGSEAARDAVVDWGCCFLFAILIERAFWNRGGV